jgi:MFS family permease
MASAPAPETRRWIVVAAATLALAAGFGVLTTINVLIAPFEREFGWLRGDVSFAYTLASLGAAAGGLAAGRLADRLPVAPIAMAGSVALGLGMVLIAGQSSLQAIQLTYLGLGLLGFSCLYAPVLTAVSHWFPAGRGGFALGIVTAGGALGQGVVPPILQALVAAHGWRSGCVMFGLGFVAVVLPAMALIRKPATPAAAPAGQLERQPAAHPAVSLALLGIASVFCCASMAVPLVHLVSFALGRGLPGGTAASVTTVLMLSACVGRIATGTLADRLGSLPTYALASAWQTAVVLLFIPAGQLWAIYVVAAVFGLGFGGVMTALICCVRDAVPRQRLGGTMALVGLLAWVGMGAGGWQGGICFDLTGDYDLAFLSASAAGLVNLAALGTLALLRRAGARASRPAPA